MGQEKVRKKFFKSQVKVRKNCMISQVKSKHDVCSQEMNGYDSLLVIISPFIEYFLKVIIKIIFHHSKTVCKIYKLSILMAVRGGGGHTQSCFVVHQSGKIGI